jgi:solute carrier family 25 carnitine/acylcarnitine transporter 20/29
MADSNPPGDDHISLYSVLKSLNYKQELIYGSIAGVAISIVGHPFDTIKTCMQFYRTSLVNTVKLIFKNHGPFGFYWGIASPLYTSAFINAIIFSVYECSRTLIAHHYRVSVDHYGVILASAGLAGFTNSFFIGPIELLKIKLQIEAQNKTNHSKYIDVLKRIYKVGGPLGIFQGVTSAMIRDCISYPFQFGSYMLTLKYLASRDKENKNRFHHFIIGGGVGGFFCWTSSYPIDTAKTMIQAREPNGKIRLKFTGEIAATLKEIYRKEGCKGLFAGYTACLGRAFIANAFGFLAWETSKTVLKY